MIRCLVLLCLAGCGGGFSDADTKAATDAVRLEATALDLCGVGSDACAPSQVRAVERAALCLNSSMLYRHELAVPDAGVSCQAR